MFTYPSEDDPNQLVAEFGMSTIAVAARYITGKAARMHGSWDRSWAWPSGSSDPNGSSHRAASSTLACAHLLPCHPANCSQVPIVGVCLTLREQGQRRGLSIAAEQHCSVALLSQQDSSLPASARTPATDRACTCRCLPHNPAIALHLSRWARGNRDAVRGGDGGPGDGCADLVRGSS